MKLTHWSALAVAAALVLPAAHAEATMKPVEVRFVGNSVVGSKTRLTIPLGTKQGVVKGMKGYVKAHWGKLCDFVIVEVKERVSFADVDVTIDSLKGHEIVVVNKTLVVKTPKHTKARVVDFAADAGGTKITIGYGSNRGAHKGMAGLLVDENGKTLGHFKIVEARSMFSVAHIAKPLDEVKKHDAVVLNP